MNPVQAFLPQTYWGRLQKYYAFTLLWASLAISTQAQVADNGGVLISTDADFLCLKISHVITDTAGTTETDFPPVELQINVGGVPWSDLAIQLGNVSGRMADTGPGPFVLPFPAFIAGGSKLSAVAKNYAATAWRLQIAFHGIWISKDLSGGVAAGKQ